MAYRKDVDLEFLKYCKNEDLDILVNYLTRGKSGNLRWTESLTINEIYKNNNPNHKAYWDLIASEIQMFGANTIMTVVRGGEGVLYKEILMDVCKKMKVNFNKKATTEFIEQNLLMKILTDSLEKMSTEDIKELIDALGLKVTNFSKQAVMAALQTAIRLGKFKIYQVAVIVANAVSKIILKRGLAYASNKAITRSISLFSGPIGWVLNGLWTLLDISDPAYRVTIPSVIHIAYMRTKLTYKDEI
jgi:uncharacterized protein YaaW (UPF0174 family)